MKTLLVTTCFMLAMRTPAMAQWLNGDVTVVSSDERSLVFEYRPHFLPDRIVGEGSSEMKIIDFVGSVPTVTPTTMGGPDLRYEAIPVGFPSQDGNAAQLIASDYEDVPGVTLAPVPAARVNNGMVQIAGYNVAPEKYSASTFLPLEPVELPVPNRARTMWVGSVKVFPFQYNPSTHTVRKYSRMVVEVIFGSSSMPRVQNQDDVIFDGALLNYNVARNWKFSDQRGLRKVNLAPSVLASGDWYRLTVVDEGVYAISASYLRSLGIDPASIDPRTIKIYGNGGKEVPESNLVPRPSDLVEDAIYVEGEGDGRFDEGDYVLFFGKAVRNWSYEPSTHLLSHYINHYSDQNFYWLTVGGGPGKRMTVQQSLSDVPIAAPAKFTDMVLIENDQVNLLASGKDWFGQAYAPGASHTYVNLLPGLASNDVITYRFRLIARSDITPSFTVQANGDFLGTYSLSPVFYESANTYASERVVTATGTSNLAGNTSQLNFAFSGSISATGWNDWIEIQYPRELLASNGTYLRFRSPDNISGVAEYTLGQFTGAPFILDVTRPDSVRRITGAVGTYTFRALETTGQVSEYCAATTGGFKQPAAALRVSNQNLHGEDPSADFIIITSPEFRAAADRLKAYREQPQHGGLATVVVDVNQIYNEFGGGLVDVTAIRDYLKYAYNNWVHRPQFVLFMGQGSYDYKGILGSRSSYVPTWQSNQSLDGVESYSSDDFFVRFTDSTSPFLVTGRVNARGNPNINEADAFVTKLIGYETASARDAWKMRMLFVGDDGWTSDCGECEGTIHSAQAEQLATDYTPDEFEKRKIYIAEYPTVQTAQGRRKPGAFQDIIDRINEGMLVVNYTGHGNPTLWAHESIFTVDASIPALTNSSRLAVFFLATCNFSEFDDPKRYSGSELLMNKPDGGAIGAVSATRKVYSFDNAVFHQGTFADMFRRDSFGRLIVERPATAIQIFKSTGSNSTNDQKFFFMGDPTMRLQYPAGYMSIDSINHQAVTATSPPIQLRALDRISVQGTARDASNQIDSTEVGRVLLNVNDASRVITIPNFSPGLSWSYIGAGGTIYRGQNSVVNGHFNATFVVPKDILYADSTNKGRLVAYFVDTRSSAEGAGYTNNVRVGGTADVPPDTTGPSLMVYLGSRSFRPGDVVGETPTLIVDLVDSNGINTSVSGIGHRIEAWVNGSSQSKDITEYYTSQLDDFQKGTVQYGLTGLPQGRNTLRVRAWDTFNNAGSRETYFEVSSTDQLRISDVFNYPNPFAGGTAFTFKQNLQTPLNVTVKIYTVAGRLIQSIDAFSSGDPFVKVPWDGRDRDGDILANGVYLYKVVVRSTDGRFGSEVLGKLSVLR